MLLSDCMLVRKTSKMSFAVGSRIVSDGYVGTVRFIGVVLDTSDEWVGIEWDDPTKGKHDGTKNGTRYFQCKSITGGSFVRPHKITVGISICDAIRERYTEPDAVGNSEESDMVIMCYSGCRKVEIVGKAQVQQEFQKLHKLQHVGLRDQLISTAGENKLLSTLAPSIAELDISKNLLSTWETIYDIAEQLSHLRILNLSENRLTIAENPQDWSPAFSSLHTLILNKCHLTWDRVMKYSPMWPKIRNLHLSHNHISELTSPSAGIFTELELLDLSCNNIEHWDYVRELSSFPKLSTLLLSDCNISDIKVSPGEFQQLRHVSLANNKIEKVQVFNELNKLPALENLTFRRNPVLNLEEKDVMNQLIIAKIRRLKLFNRSEIDQGERTNAELDYLRKYGMEWKESGGNENPEGNKPSEEFVKNHPRFMEIIEEYGPPIDNQNVQNSSSRQANIIELTIEAPAKPGFQPVKRRLPLSMTIGSLKLFLQKLINSDVVKQQVVYVSKKNPNLVVPLQRDCETLHDVSIEPCDVIQVLPSQVAVNSEDSLANDIDGLRQ